MPSGRGLADPSRSPATTIRILADTSCWPTSELFRALDADDVQQVAGEAPQRHAAAATIVIFSEDDDADELFVVRSGRIAIAKRSTDGRESVVALMEAGDLFGEMGLFDGEPRSADARALEPSDWSSVPFASLTRPCSKSGPSSCGTSSQLLVAACAPPTTRWPTRCSSTSPAAPPSACSSWPATPTSSRCRSPRRSSPAMVGASRERVNKAIASFVRLGWIEQVDRRYRIVDRVQLGRHAT